MASYSTSSLIHKLGIKENMSLLILHEPEHYFTLLGPLPKGASIHTQGAMFDFIHFFAISQAQVEKIFAFLAKSLKYSGIMWISWPKKTSEIVSDLNDNKIRDIGLSHGLVDIKVCAIDSNWSGLKFVYRMEDRK